jgi:hypothetical protein
VRYDASSECFSLDDEQAFALAVEGSPAFIPGAFEIAVAQFKAIPKMISAFRTGLGLGWHEHDTALFHGTERFFRPATRRTSCRAGSRRSMASRRGCATARRWPTSAAATARRR